MIISRRNGSTGLAIMASDRQVTAWCSIKMTSTKIEIARIETTAELRSDRAKSLGIGATIGVIIETATERIGHNGNVLEVVVHIGAPSRAMSTDHREDTTVTDTDGLMTGVQGTTIGTATEGDDTRTRF